MRTKLAPSILGIALVLFLLPWCDVNCAGQKFMSLTGTDMAIGKTIQQSEFFGAKGKSETVRDMRVTAAFVILLAGTIMGFLAGSMDDLRKVIIALSGVGSVVLLLFFKFATDGEVQRQGQGLITVGFTPAFWLTVLCSAGAPVLEFGATTVTSLPASGNTIAIQSSSPSRYCAHCGAQIVAGDRFCGECGSAIG
jgi:hypothetical protein